MQIDILEIRDDDTVIVFVPVGSLEPSSIDTYISKILKPLKEIFKCEIAAIPTREINQIDFTVVRKV